MDLELDEGHDQPVFGPSTRSNMAERFRLGREIVRRYCDRAVDGTPNSTSRMTAVDGHAKLPVGGQSTPG
jgi:hypothetical protein